MYIKGVLYIIKRPEHLDGVNFKPNFPASTSFGKNLYNSSVNSISSRNYNAYIDNILKILDNPLVVDALSNDEKVLLLKVIRNELMVNVNMALEYQEQILMGKTEKTR